MMTSQYLESTVLENGRQPFQKRVFLLYFLRQWPVKACEGEIIASDVLFTMLWEVRCCLWHITCEGLVFP